MDIEFLDKAWICGLSLQRAMLLRISHMTQHIVSIYRATKRNDEPEFRTTVDENDYINEKEYLCETGDDEFYAYEDGRCFS